MGGWLSELRGPAGTRPDPPSPPQPAGSAHQSLEAKACTAAGADGRQVRRHTAPRTARALRCHQVVGQEEAVEFWREGAGFEPAAAPCTSWRCQLVHAAGKRANRAETPARARATPPPEGPHMEEKAGDAAPAVSVVKEVWSTSGPPTLTSPPRTVFLGGGRGPTRAAQTGRVGCRTPAPGSATGAISDIIH